MRVERKVQVVTAIGTGAVCITAGFDSWKLSKTQVAPAAGASCASKAANLFKSSDR
jgi:hypothetical protein